MKRTVFFISDRTGITAEMLGHSLLTQFEQIKFEVHTLPFIDSAKKAQQAVEKINLVAVQEQQRAIVFATVVDPEIQQFISQANAVVLNFFDTFIKPLESEFAFKSSYRVGQSHSIHNSKEYNHRMDAVNYALNCDDGVGIRHYKDGDVILLGVSRCGKTPTSLYLALQFGIYVANYPLTEEDIDKQQLPQCLRHYRDKLFGLTIDPDRLHALREERRPNSHYASLRQCREETREVEGLYRREKIPFLNTTMQSVEEISTKVLEHMGLKRRVY